VRSRVGVRVRMKSRVGVRTRMRWRVGVRVRVTAKTESVSSSTALGDVAE